MYLTSTPELKINEGNLKFNYLEKAAKFCEIFALLLSYVVPVKSKVKISQNFVTFSDYMNFKNNEISEVCTVLVLHKYVSLDMNDQYILQTLQRVN